MCFTAQHDKELRRKIVCVCLYFLVWTDFSAYSRTIS